MQDFSVQVLPVDAEDTVVLRPNGSIDSATTPVLENHFKTATANHQHRIVLDLSNIDFISSSGLGLILGTVGELRERGGDLILMGIPDHVADAFDVLTVEDYFHTIKNLDDISVTQR